jgi:two-component system, response regulator PdtaR
MDRIAGKGPVVLVVEDEGLLRASAMDMVKEAGFDVLAASDADEAIRVLESRSDIRAVFTDVHMPGSMDGLRLARVIRSRWPPVALIVTSAKRMCRKATCRQADAFYRNRTTKHRSEAC